MEFDLEKTFYTILGAMIVFTLSVWLGQKYFAPAPKKLYKVTFNTGSVIIDSLRDENSSLKNDRITYPKSSIFSYQEIKSKQKK